MIVVQFAKNLLKLENHWSRGQSYTQIISKREGLGVTETEKKTKMIEDDGLIGVAHERGKGSWKQKNYKITICMCFKKARGKKKEIN